MAIRPILMPLIFRQVCNRIWALFKINSCLKLPRINKWLSNNSNSSTVFNNRKTIRKDISNSSHRIRWASSNLLISNTSLLIYKLKWVSCINHQLFRPLVDRSRVLNNTRCNSKLVLNKGKIIIIIKASSWLILKIKINRRTKASRKRDRLRLQDFLTIIMVETKVNLGQEWVIILTFLAPLKSLPAVMDLRKMWLLRVPLLCLKASNSPFQCLPWKPTIQLLLSNKPRDSPKTLRLLE